jgi:hypothetical protein
MSNNSLSVCVPGAAPVVASNEEIEAYLENLRAQADPGGNTKPRLMDLTNVGRSSKAKDPYENDPPDYQRRIDERKQGRRR